MGRLVRAIRDTNWRAGPDIGTSQKGVRQLRSTIDQIELTVNSRAGVTCHGDVRGFAGDGLVRAVRYADRCVRPYVCAGEEGIGGLCCTAYEVVLGVDGRAGITCNGFVCRLAWWGAVRAVWNTDGG